MISNIFRDRFIVSICGPSGTGKSQTAVALVETLGRHRSVWIPTDYYLVPASKPLDEYLREPLEYDWPSIEQALARPIGTTVKTPQFDFETFQRTARTGGRTYTVRPICVIDAMYPCPFAGVKVIVQTPSDERRARVASRDLDWGTNVLGRWEHLEICDSHLNALEMKYDLRLSGLHPVDANADSILQIVNKLF